MIRFYVNDLDISEFICAVSSSVSFEENKLIGNTPSMEIKLVVNNSGGVFDDLLSFPFIMKKDDEQVGVYYVVDQPESMMGKITLNLYDAMIYSNMNYESSLAYPTTLNDVLNEMSLILNKTFDTSEIENRCLDRIINVYDSSISIRTHLGYIGELCACNVTVVNDVYCFKKVSKEIVYEALNSDVESFVKGEEYVFSGVRYDDGAVVLEAGNEAANVYEIDTNNLYLDSQGDVDFIYECLNGLSFTNIESMKMITFDKLEIGKLFQLQDQFICFPSCIDTTYFNADYDISEVKGTINNTISNETSVIESASSKIKKIQTKIDKNEGIFSVLSEQVEKIEKQTTYISDTPPSDIHKLWLDTSMNPNVLKYYDGIDWVKLNTDNEEFSDVAHEILQEYSASLQLSNDKIEAAIQEIKATINEQSTSIEELSHNINLTNEGLIYQKAQAESLRNELNEKVSEEILSEYIRFDGAEIELGKNSSEFKTIITNDELAFYQGSSDSESNKIAYMSNKEMFIKKANIEERMNIGEFQFMDENELGFSLI